MPAVVWGAIGFVAGDFAGLVRSGEAWVAGPLLAALGLLAWRRRALGAVALVAAASGVVWGAADATRAGRDCRARWREGERVALVVRLWDLALPGRPSRATVVWPERCAGALEVVWPSWTAPPKASAVVAGTWHRSAASASRWPARPARLGRLVARTARPLALSAGARASLRLATERRITDLFSRAQAPLAAALTVAADDQLDREIRQRFARAGIAHILSISGLHVGILGAALLLLLRAGRVPDGPARLAGLSLVAAYVFFLGLPAPAVRSIGLIALWCWSRLRQRPLVPHAALAATALVVVGLDPFAVSEAGPWLSFAGAWGCALAARAWTALRRARALAGHPRIAAVLAVGAVSGGATLATAPVSILVFGTMAPAALVSNVLAVPIAGFVMPALALTLTLAAAWPAAARLAAPVASVGLAALDRVASLAGALPLATVAFERRLLAAALLGVLAWLVLRPLGRGGAVRTSRVLAARAVLALALAAAAAAWWPLIPGAPSGYRPGWLTLHFLPVGQGDATLVETPGGRWIAVDGGPRTLGYDAGASVVAPFLRRSLVRRLALVVASHGDADHLGGLPTLVRVFRPQLVLEPGEPLPRQGYRRWLAAVARAGSRWHRARAGDSVALDGAVLRVLHPDSAWMVRGLPANENSVVASLDYGAFRALLPGDAGLAFEAGEAARLPAGGATLLKVAHHGSATATGPAFLAAVRPRICIVSVGPNRYGLPDPRLLAELGRAGCEVFRTDVDGAVTVETDGRVVRVRAGARERSFISTREQP